MSWPNPLSSLTTLVRDRIDEWHAHGQPNAARVLAEHPELQGARSLVMDLALAEYSLRKEAGDAIEPDAFCDQFPDHRQSLLYQLEVQDYLDRCPSFAAPDESAGWPIPGDEFLGYEILEPLGRGGLARVFLASETAVGDRHVVIKVSPFGDREAQTLGKLSHPGIVPIHSVKHDTDGDWTVICMPLVGAATGIDLLDAAFNRPETIRDAALVARVAHETRPLTASALPKQEKQPFPWHYSYGDAVCQLGLDIAEALNQAHAVGVLHRDIKPSNILLSWSGRAMLLDFNLSTRDELAQQRLGGTLAYMAPEVIESLLKDQGRAARRFDPRSDIYSLGVVLYELLTGRLPFKPKDTARLADNAYEPWLECKRQTRALSLNSSAIDPALAAIVLRCVEFDPAKRYADAASLVAALRKHLSRGTVVARMAKQKRREIVLSVIALASCLIGLFYYVGSRPSELDSLYAQALAEYDAGQYVGAAGTFTHCLQLRSGWPQALFGRAQSLRRQKQWQAARTDYVALAEAEPRWAYALGGYCNLKANDGQAALFDFRRAYENGLRDVGFLQNYAKAQLSRGKLGDAETLYSEILAIDPVHKTALHERPLMFIAMAMNDKHAILEGLAFTDAQRYYELDKTFEGPFLAAKVYGEAARKDKTYEDQAVRFLAEAIQKGLPGNVLSALPREVKWLLPKIDAKVVQNAISNKKVAALASSEVIDPPTTADWVSFLRSRAVDPRLLAGRQ